MMLSSKGALAHQGSGRLPPSATRLRLTLAIVVLPDKGRFALRPCQVRAPLAAVACDGGSGDQTSDAGTPTSGSQDNGSSRLAAQSAFTRGLHGWGLRWGWTFNDHPIPFFDRHGKKALNGFVDADCSEPRRFEQLFSRMGGDLL